MTEVEILNRCGEQFPFYRKFLDRCINEFVHETQDTPIIQQLADTLGNMICDGHNFYKSTPEVIVAYKNKLKYTE